MFENFRYWWIGGVFTFLPSSFRRHKKGKQPICHAFIDDKGDDEPYPHVHAVCWVPGDVVARFEAWFGLPRTSESYVSKAENAWNQLEERAELHIFEMDRDQSAVKNVVFYASKYHNEQLQWQGGEDLMRSFPEQPITSSGSSRQSARTDLTTDEAAQP